MKTRILVFACLMLTLITNAQNLNNLPNLELAPFAEGFKYPIDVANCGDSRLFIAERLGKIWAVDANGERIGSSPFLNITDRVFTVFPQDYDERGLLGMAFHPNYPDSPYFYVNYTGFDSNSHISRFRVDPNDPNKALKNSELTLLIVEQPKDPEFVNHKAGCLKFGPDGYLYGTFGDGGSAGDPLNNGQDLTVLLGKMFRIDVNKPDLKKQLNYSIPPTNPFVGMNGVREEIWASGLRNPFRFSFDRLTGDLWLPDVGQDRWEEINVEFAGKKGGRNYGWSCYEGSHNFKPNKCEYNGMPLTFPKVQYGHSTNTCTSITGGFVYRGAKYPNLYGLYIYNDYCDGKYSVVFRQNESWMNVKLLDEEDGEYVSFGEDSQGELYSVDQPTGEVERVIDAGRGKNLVQNNSGIFSVKLSPNPNHGQFTVELNSQKKELYSITVTNAMGVSVISESRTGMAGINRWNFSSYNLQKGVYLLHVQAGDTGITQNFIVDK